MEQYLAAELTATCADAVIRQNVCLKLVDNAPVYLDANETPLTGPTKVLNVEGGMYFVAPAILFSYLSKYRRTEGIA